MPSSRAYSNKPWSNARRSARTRGTADSLNVENLPRCALRAPVVRCEPVVVVVRSGYTSVKLVLTCRSNVTSTGWSIWSSSDVETTCTPLPVIWRSSRRDRQNAEPLRKSLLTAREPVSRAESKSRGPLGAFSGRFRIPAWFDSQGARWLLARASQCVN